jgi:hypothetical protein
VNYLEAQGSIPNRYKYFNNPEGNTPINPTDELRGSTLLPDVEDVDRDFCHECGSRVIINMNFPLIR